MTIYRNHLQILKEWPSIVDLARDLDLPYDTVRNWHRPGRENIPAEYWLAIIAAGRKRKIKLCADDFL